MELFRPEAEGRLFLSLGQAQHTVFVQARLALARSHPVLGLSGFQHPSISSKSVDATRRQFKARSRDIIGYLGVSLWKSCGLHNISAFSKTFGATMSQTTVLCFACF
jgi:hypothetical protein